jgi:hypothetical protein
MFDVEKLIAEVKSRTCIWNGELSSKEKALKQMAWQEVAAGCYPNWDNYTNEEKKFKGM